MALINEMKCIEWRFLASKLKHVPFYDADIKVPDLNVSNFSIYGDCIGFCFKLSNSSMFASWRNLEAERVESREEEKTWLAP